jgi:uncharacterized protein YlxP (DUF503 family)
MIVGAALVELHVQGSRSLKEKRGVVRSLSRRLRNRFNVSVAEVGGQGTWQRAALGIAATGSSELRVRQHLQQALRFVEDTHLAEVTGTDIECFETGYAETWSREDEEDPGWPASWNADPPDERNERDKGDDDVPPDRPSR